jgi:hypothetical protein
MVGSALTARQPARVPGRVAAGFEINLPAGFQAAMLEVVLPALVIVAVQTFFFRPTSTSPRPASARAVFLWLSSGQSRRGQPSPVHLRTAP